MVTCFLDTVLALGPLMASCPASRPLAEEASCESGLGCVLFRSNLTFGDGAAKKVAFAWPQPKSSACIESASATSARARTTCARNLHGGMARTFKGLAFVLQQPHGGWGFWSVLMRAPVDRVAQR